MSERRIHISLKEQRLNLFDSDAVLKTYQVSTSRYGAGEVAGSFQTPRGQHIVRAKIGSDEPQGTVFRGRRSAGQIYSAELARAHPNWDWVLTRILWLSGTEVGKNRLGLVDSMRRYIYIHGTPHLDNLGEPTSLGCIRMSNDDVVELFDLVSFGTVVEIKD